MQCRKAHEGSWRASLRDAEAAGTAALHNSSRNLATHLWCATYISFSNASHDFLNGMPYRNWPVVKSARSRARSKRESQAKQQAGSFHYKQSRLEACITTSQVLRAVGEVDDEDFHTLVRSAAHNWQVGSAHGSMCAVALASPSACSSSYSIALAVACPLATLHQGGIMM